MHVNFVLTNWTYQQYNDFLTAFAQQNFREAGHLAESVIADWSVFDDIPEAAEHPFDHLSLDDAYAVIIAIQQKTKEYTESLDVDKDIAVDLTKWKWNDFNKFKEYVSEGDLDSAVSMMREVTRLKKGNPKKGEPLNAVQGIVMFSALQEHIRRIFTGGN